MIQHMQQVEQYIESMKQGNVLHFQADNDTPTAFQPFGIGMDKMYGAWWVTVYHIIETQDPRKNILKPVKGYKKFLLDTATVQDWLSRLEYLCTHGEYLAKKG